MGLHKRELLRAALSVIAGNLDLQRLYSEFSEQLNAANDLKECDNLLDIWSGLKKASAFRKVRVQIS